MYLLYNGSASRPHTPRWVVGSHPKPSDLAISRPQDESLKGLIHERRKALERLMVRGERLIKLGDGWFSTKAIEVA